MKLSIEITRDDYSEFCKFHFMQTKLKRTIITGLITVSIMLLYFNRNGFDWFLSLIGITVYPIIFIFTLKRALNKTKKIPDSNGLILGKKELEFTEDLIIYSASTSQGTYEWSSIQKLKENSKAFYLYMDANMAIMVPKKALNSASETDEFRQLVFRKIGV